MNDETENAELKHFFSAYFNEDWFSDSEDPRSVVAEYAQTLNEEQRRRVSKAVLDYSDKFERDRDLEERLFSELGCYFQPSGAGLSARAWLKDVASQLLETPCT